MNGLVEEWFQKIKPFLPEDGSVVVTVQRVPRNRHLVSFRASAAGETFISEVREPKLENAVRLAGERLVERLELSQPRKRSGFGEKVKRLFREAS